MYERSLHVIALTFVKFLIFQYTSTCLQKHHKGENKGK